MERGLIYDVGMHNGDDTAYYLHCGYQVVGVEANPLMAATLRSRFADAIETKRLNLLALGIAESDGQKHFWVCDDHTEWSSFDRGIASRLNSRHHAVAVQTRRFGGILAEY